MAILWFMAELPWYADGLRFECTRCGHCCTGRGSVRVSDAEIESLARRLGLSEHEFRATCTREPRRGVVVLREKGNTDCVFLEGGRRCRVYVDRPRQCRTWPFWRAVVHSAESWTEEAKCCPGMNRGPLHDADSIQRASRNDGTSARLPQP